jgi:hypothetical protein
MNKTEIIKAIQRIIPRIECDVLETGNYEPIVEKIIYSAPHLNVSNIRLEIESAGNEYKNQHCLHLYVDSASGNSTANTLFELNYKNNILSVLNNKALVDRITNRIELNAESFDDKGFA